jgi:hypothetical protein
MPSSPLGQAGPGHKKREVSIKPDFVSQTKFVTVSLTSPHTQLHFSIIVVSNYLILMCYQDLLSIVLVLAVTTSPYSWCKV